jgi:hypothetical protein
MGITIPYPSMQKFPTLSPSEEDLKIANYKLTQEIIYHQNNNCPYMHKQRQEMMLAIKPKSRRILLENKLITPERAS